MRTCSYHLLLAEVEYFAHARDDEVEYASPTETCASVPTRYTTVDVHGGTFRMWLCGQHDIAARALNGYAGSVPLMERTDQLTAAHLRGLAQGGAS